MSKISISKILKEFPYRFPKDLIYTSSTTSINPLIQKNDEELNNVNKFRILVQNMWGLPVIAPDLTDRVKGFAEIIKTNQYDIIIIVELWCKREQDILIKAAEEVDIKYYHYFRPGIGFVMWPLIHGSGILVLSRFPIVETLYKRYTVNGNPYMIHHADYYGSKGCGLLRIQINKNQQIDLYCTHPQASYKSDRSDYLCCRMSQAFELCKFIENSKKNELVIIGGDLNSYPNELNSLLLKYMIVGIKDSWLETNKNKPYNDGITVGSKENCYIDRPQRIDYIYYLDNTKEKENNNISEKENDNSNVRWKLISGKVEKFHSYNGKYSVSDHFGVSSVFELINNNDNNDNEKGNENKIEDEINELKIEDKSKLLDLMDESIHILKEGIAEDEQTKGLHYIRSFFCLLLILSLSVRINYDMPLYLKLLVNLILPIVMVVEFLYSKFFICDELSSLEEDLNELVVLKRSIISL